MKIEILSSLDFVINRDEISSTKGEPFYIQKIGNKMVISDDCDSGNSGNTCISGNGISVSNNTVYINGISIASKGRALSIKGDVDTIFLNGENIDLNTSSAKNNAALKENQHVRHRLKEAAVDDISIKGSGSLKIVDNSPISDSLLAISVNGSGDVIFDVEEYFVSSLNLSIMGSGDIKFDRFEVGVGVCSIIGSGSIVMYDSYFNNTLNCSISGSGDIVAIDTSAKKIVKNVIGSGDISGL